MSITMLLFEHFFTKQNKHTKRIQMTQIMITISISLLFFGGSIVVEELVVVFGAKVVVFVISVHSENTLQ